MKNFISLVALLVCVNLTAQQKKLRDYFFSMNHNQKEYRWDTGTSQTIFEYEQSRLENNKIIISTKKVLPNGNSFISVDSFKVFDTKIVHYSSETSMSGKQIVNSIIMKNPKSKWTINSDKYTSYKTSVKVGDNEYTDCIAIKKSNSGYSTIIKYYAYNLGLIKEEAFTTNNKLVYNKTLK